MKISAYLENIGLSQAALAKILCGSDDIPLKVRVRAHRIWHGAKPNEEEIRLFHKATDGQLDANVFFGLAPSNNHKPKRK